MKVVINLKLISLPSGSCCYYYTGLISSITFSTLQLCKKNIDISSQAIINQWPKKVVGKAATRCFIFLLRCQTKLQSPK